jgi:protein-tyrosine kinase
MERISRALELARAQRESYTPNATVGDADNSANVAVNSILSRESRVDHLSAKDKDRVPLRPRTVKFNRDEHDGERIVTPGCAGKIGVPYKMLRTQVLKRLDQLNANTLAILGATSGAGKTLTAINLAIAIAADSGRTALLIDFDLRNPSIHRRFGFTPEIGIEDCLRHHKYVDEAMIKVEGYDRLTIIPAKERSVDSSELLRSQRTADLVAEMRQRYANRVLIFDLPPVLQADDALAFSHDVQAGLLVVGETRTRREDVTRSIELLSELTIIGTVLNGSRERVDPYN